MIKFEIKSIAGILLWSGEAESLGKAVEKAVKDGANLYGANLYGANLDGANLDGASLDGANLYGANLYGANLDGASLNRANLNRANLYGANLYGANLDGASLDGASLYGANLDGANLYGASLNRANLNRASLDGANLDAVIADLRLVLDAAPAEVVGLLAALREGRVDGKVYEGECACLVGTIANIRKEKYSELSIGLRPDSSRAAEVWFLGIRRGDSPANSQIVKLTVGWIEKWLSDKGETSPVHKAVYWRGDAAQLRADLIAAGVDLAQLAAGQ